jgi:hypothetical protein
VSAALAYNGLALDRVPGRRETPEWIEALLARPASRVIPFWRDGCLVRDLAGPGPVVLGAAAAAAVLEHAALCMFLGLGTTTPGRPPRAGHSLAAQRSPSKARRPAK